MEFDSHSWVLWVGVIAAVIHVLEEYALGWVAWANHELGPRLGIEVTETGFLLSSVSLVFGALAGAAIGWWGPAISLAIPALFVINAVFFHMLPSARTERIIPGTISAVFIYLPVAAWMYWAAAEDGHLSFGTFILSFILGAAFMAWPIALLYLKDRIGWDAEYVAVAAAARDAKAEQAAKDRAKAQAAAVAAAAAAPAEPEPVEVTEDPVNLDEEDSAVELAEDAAVEGEEPADSYDADEGIEDEGDDTTVMRRD
ncbi:MAG: HXXEE domain-containing protein [Solirubrobacterales bacterium]